MKLSFTKVAVLVMAVAVLACTETANELRPVSKVTAPEFVPGEVLIKFKKPVAAGSRTAQSVLALIQATPVETIATSAMTDAAARNSEPEGPLMLVSSKLGTEQAIAILQGNSDVQYAEPNWIYHHFATSNDTYVTNNSLWGMTGSFGSQASTAWTNNKTDCSNVYVGIIDEGYMFAHEDLAANAAVNPGETAGNGRDDDGNGLVDDVYGWDFAGNNNTVFDGTGDDHGTHVAGTIGGVGGNGRGVAGVCWKVKLLNAKFLGSTGGTTTNAIKAVDYFTDLKNRHNLNIVATSNSWGGGGYSQALADAIERANSANILFIAAAGNSMLNCETSDCFPAEYGNANVISVASITSTGGISSFSNFGSTTIDIGAPGSGVWSSVPTASGKGKNATIASGYASYNGTSMATPHVSGAAALYKALNPSATAAQIKNAILSSATPTSSLAGKCVSGGRLNVSGF